MPKDGDAVIVLRGDGSTGIFTLGIEPAKLMARIGDGTALSEEDERQLDVTVRAFALYAAATNPKIMNALIEMSNDPNVFDPAVLASMPKLN